MWYVTDVSLSLCMDVYRALLLYICSRELFKTCVNVIIRTHTNHHEIVSINLLQYRYI